MSGGLYFKFGETDQGAAGKVGRNGAAQRTKTKTNIATLESKNNNLKVK
jgi:hypothetical protein